MLRWRPHRPGLPVFNLDIDHTMAVGADEPKAFISIGRIQVSECIGTVSADFQWS